MKNTFFHLLVRRITGHWHRVNQLIPRWPFQVGIFFPICKHGECQAQTNSMTCPQLQGQEAVTCELESVMLKVEFFTVHLMPPWILSCVWGKRTTYVTLSSQCLPCLCNYFLSCIVAGGLLLLCCCHLASWCRHLLPPSSPWFPCSRNHWSTYPVPHPPLFSILSPLDRGYIISPTFGAWWQTNGFLEQPPENQDSDIKMN